MPNYKPITFCQKKNDQAIHIENFLKNKIKTHTQLSKKLGCTRQHTYILINRYKSQNKDFIEHKNTNK